MITISLGYSITTIGDYAFVSSGNYTLKLRNVLETIGNHALENMLFNMIMH